MYLKNFICVFFVLITTNVSSQVEQTVVDEIIVVSNRVPMPLEKITTSVTLLSEEEIKSYGNLSLKDVLRQTPAIGTTSNGGIGATSSIRIRGEEGFRTLVLFF